MRIRNLISFQRLHFIAAACLVAISISYAAVGRASAGAAELCADTLLPAQTMSSGLMPFAALREDQVHDLIFESDEIIRSSDSNTENFLVAPNAGYLTFISQLDKKTAYSQVYFAEDGKVGGFIFARFDNRSGPSGRVHIDKLAVSPKLRGNRIAPRLLRATALRALERNRGEIELFVLTQNANALHLYIDKLGFKDISNTEPTKTQRPSLRLWIKTEDLLKATQDLLRNPSVKLETQKFPSVIEDHASALVSAS
jgi:ribosomal protein S18 acetylase RimI-like enzyme